MLKDGLRVLTVLEVILGKQTHLLAKRGIRLSGGLRKMACLMWMKKVEQKNSSVLLLPPILFVTSLSCQRMRLLWSSIGIAWKRYFRALKIKIQVKE